MRLTLVEDYNKIGLLLLCFVVLFFVLSQIELKVLNENVQMSLFIAFMGSSAPSEFTGTPLQLNEEKKLSTKHNKLTTQRNKGLKKK